MGRVASYCLRGFHAFMRETDATRSDRNQDKFKILEKPEQMPMLV